MDGSKFPADARSERALAGAPAPGAEPILVVEPILVAEPAPEFWEALGGGRWLRSA